MQNNNTIGGILREYMQKSSDTLPDLMPALTERAQQIKNQEYIQNKIYRLLTPEDRQALEEYLLYYGDENPDTAMLDQFIEECYHYEEESDSWELNMPDELPFVENIIDGHWVVCSWNGTTVKRLRN